MLACVVGGAMTVGFEAYRSSSECYGTEFCSRQGRMTPFQSSRVICFRQSVEFMMGSDQAAFKVDGEGPRRKKTLSPFCIDLTEVSNRQFSEFATATRYRTEVIV